MSGAAERLTVSRGFVTIGERQVHYRVLGEGPPALFIHSSPTNSSFVLDDMRAQAGRYRCFAFDTPGFGLSDPLPLTTMTVADLADATAAAMEAVGLPPVPVFGTHSGAAIALELGYRHPHKVTGLMLDALPIFTRDEVSALGEDYFAPLVVDPLGGHYSATWTRFRDQSIWWPWCARIPDRLNEYDLGSPESIHRWVEMFFAAAPHYKAAYSAAIGYCEGAIEAAAGLTVPAVFTASNTDMLRPHLRRLPPLKPGQEVIGFGADYRDKRKLTGEAFARFGSDGVAPVPYAGLSDAWRIRRQFVMDDGRSLMIRHGGSVEAPPLLLVHDAPGSGALLEARMRDLASRHLVIAPDLPGSGESEGLGEGAEMADYAAALWRMCDRLGIAEAAIEARGFGASLGVELAAQAPGRCRALAIDGLFLPDPDERVAFRDRYAPPIRIERDGAHWYRLWLMLRDSLVYWPWFDTRRDALRRTEADFDPAALHMRTIEVMKQHATWHRFLHAAFQQDAAARLAACAAPVERIADPLSALSAAYGDRLDALLRERTASPAERVSA